MENNDDNDNDGRESSRVVVLFRGLWEEEDWVSFVYLNGVFGSLSICEFFLFVSVVFVENKKIII